MAGVFGEAHKGQVSPENPLGLNRRAPEDEAADTGEPKNDGAADNGNVNQGQEQQAQTNEGQVEEEKGSVQKESEQVQNIDVNDDMDKKVEFVRRKFDGPEDFEKSIKELQQKLGRNNENPSFQNQEEAINYYIQLEKELGKTSNIDQTRRENQRLKQELNQLRNTVMQMQNNQIQQQNQTMRGYGRPNQNQRQQGQPRDPQTGQFRPKEQQQNNQTANEDIDLDDFDIDVDEFMSEFYEKGVNADGFKKALKEASSKVAEQISEKKINEFLEKQRQEEQKKQQVKQQAKITHQHFKNQAEEIKQNFGQQEFENHKQDMLKVFKQYPMYLNPRLFPNGFKKAFNIARSQKKSYTQNQPQNNQNQQQINAQKKAAKMPNSQNNARFQLNQNQNVSPEERIKKQIFQGPEKRQGIFG